MPRLFIALSLPEAVKAELVTMQGGVNDARWVNRDNFHLTLRFIGEINNPTVADIVDALSGIRASAFDLALAGLGHFAARGKLRAIWAGVDRAPELLSLQRKVDHAVRDARIGQRERRYLPHVTLARFPPVPLERASGYLATRALFRTAPFQVETLTLFESILNSAGALYVPVFEHRFAGQHGAASA